MQLLKYLALPDPSEKSRGFLLQHPSLIGFAIVIVGMIFINQVIIFKIPNVLSYAQNVTVSDLMTDTNQSRSRQGLNKLTWNENLAKAANAKANDMFEKDYWAHNSPDGTEPWDFILGAGYDYLYAGENLAVDFSNSDDVVKAWIDSPSHRENLYSDKYTEIGFAVVNGELEGRKTTLVVQMFGYPRVSPPITSSDSTNINIAFAEPQEVQGVQEVQEVQEIQTGAVLNANDVFNASRYIAIILGFFLTGLFAIDELYIRRLNLNRISGNTIVHILVLLTVIVGIWYTNIGLVL